MTAEQAEEPVEQALRRCDAVGMAIGTEKRHVQSSLYSRALRILNADAQSVAGFLARFQHALLDLADYGLGGLHFLAGLLKTRHSLVDKFVAKQLIGSQR